jgi:hypothetical protein
LLKQKKVVKKNQRMQFSEDKKKHTIIQIREQFAITKDLLRFVDPINYGLFTRFIAQE